MTLEIEKKYLIANDSWKEHISKEYKISQAYLNASKERTTRIRTKGEKAYLTIKGKTTGISRIEFEYEIPHKDAIQLLELCKKPFIEKVRYEVIYDTKTWEIDVFEGENKGLIFAEIELNSEDEKFKLPLWVGKEVSDDVRYYNANLITNPFKNW